ncbi:hypothetical protein [Actinomycetospora lemnae]|uniref:Maleylpyruvate isomerase family mycothiol-dependent enzyme n=1 Tax=Actinomycetospora lemnae TaxID=3019891 RepID=A0ABT5SPJ8_9PSEU|nr:hypothetical protein [Actinomycetospora sp. DW7H6]MDD7964766.1 hypothetical protein [Actinomycetospora sp. DW7H6]
MDTAAAVLGLWESAEDAVDGMAADDWTRDAPGPEPTVGDLVAHLAGEHGGVHYAAPARLRSSLAGARHREALRMAGLDAGDPVLGASCLDLCLHAHDLRTALGLPVDLAEHAPAVLAAARLVVDLAPRLLVAAVGPRAASVRLVVRAPGDDAAVLDRTVHVVDGHPAAPDRDTPPDVVDVDADALLLLLAGRRPAEALAADGAAAWSGPAADALVHRAPLAA